MLNRFWCVKYWTPMGHPVAWGMCIALPPLGRLPGWPRCGGSQKSQSPLEVLVFAVWVSCWRKAGLWWWRTFWEACQMQMITWFDLALCLLALADARPLSTKPAQEKHVLRTWWGLAKMVLTFTLAHWVLQHPCVPKTSVHSCWGFIPGACSVRVAVAWEPVG